MQIKIETELGNKATMEIDGRTLHINWRHGVIELSGLKDDELDSTLGGMLASALYTPIADIFCAMEEIDGDYGAWDKMPDDEADYVWDRLM